MAVFKPTYTGKDGKLRPTGKFYVQFRDHNEIVRRVPAYKTKRASEELEGTLGKLVDAKRNGMLPGRDLLAVIDGLPAKLRDNLLKWGLIPKQKQHVARGLADHLTDWKASLLGKGVSDKQARLVTGRASRVLTEAGCKHLSDIDRDAIERAADRLRERRGLSNQTHNFNLAAVKQFTGWLLEYDRLQVDPLGVKLAKLGARKVSTDRRHDRRALSVEEVRALLEATAAEPERHGMEGTERALLYRLALETGLRANELHTLECGRLSLKGKSPTVTVKATFAKNKTTTELPLRPATAALLKAHTRQRLPVARVFNMPPSDKTAKMFRRDVEAAGIPYRDDDGLVADFHSLRHTFITNLVNAGVHPKIAQKLARHSDIKLTMDRYTHLQRDAERSALDVLPDLDSNAGAATA
jgi:integrase